MAEAQKWGTLQLKNKNIESPALDVDVILAGLLNISRTHLVLSSAEKMSPVVIEKFQNAIERRSQNEPVAYILGKINFLGFDLNVDSRVLIPRPETEILVEKLTSTLNGKKIDQPKILDLCTGSGCISIGLAKTMTTAQITAVDISGEALKVAQDNAEINGASDRISFIQSDLYSGLEPGFKGYFDIIVSNPPYVSSEEMLQLAPDLKFEPPIALDGGRHGLNVIRPLVENAQMYLKKRGSLWMEIGLGQARHVQKIMNDCQFKNVETLQDYQDIERIIRGVYGSV